MRGTRRSSAPPPRGARPATSTPRSTGSGAPARRRGGHVRSRSRTRLASCQAMRICLMIEGQDGVMWDRWVPLAQAAEEAGIEALFRSDHYLSDQDEPTHGSLDAWATVNALAAVTKTIRLGTLVSPATFRHPSVLAKMAVTADHVSGGRIEVGLGAGWLESEHRAYGFPFEPTKTRMDVLAEKLEIVHR